MTPNRSASTVLLAALSVVVLVATVLLASVRTAAEPAPPTAAAASPFLPSVTAVGALTPAPWERPPDPTERAALAGLRMLGTEGTALHLHAHLAISVDGQAVTVPAEIGIDNPSGTVSSLHTHDTAGIIHVESPVQADFTFGEFFTEWNVALDQARIGAYPASTGETFTVFVDQEPFLGNPAALVFTNRMDIDIVVAPAGTPPGPSAPFDWPEQY